MSLSETIAGAFIQAFAEDIEAQGLTSPQQAANWILLQGREGIERRLRDIANSDRFSDAFKDVDLQTAAFFDYANCSNLSGIKAGLEVGLSPDTADGTGKTVLMRCAQSGSEGAAKCARALMDAGADVTLAAEDGSTVFHLACEDAQEEVLLELLDAAATTRPAGCGPAASSSVPATADSPQRRAESFLFGKLDDRGRTPMDRLMLPRPPKEGGRGRGGAKKQPSPEEADRERMRRATMAKRLIRYVVGVLPRARMDGQDLPPFYARAWSEDGHCYFPAPFRRAAFLLLLQSAGPCAGEEEGRPASSFLPASVWKHIFSFMHRDWVLEPESDVGACPNCGRRRSEGGDAQRDEEEEGDEEEDGCCARCGHHQLDVRAEPAW